VKNATLSVLLMLALGLTLAPAVAAQTDEPEGDDSVPSETEDDAQEAQEAEDDEDGDDDGEGAEDGDAEGEDAEDGDAEGEDAEGGDAESADAEGEDADEPVETEEAAAEEVVEGDEVPAVDTTPTDPGPAVAETPEPEEAATTGLAEPEAEAQPEEAATEEAPAEEAAAPSGPEPFPWRNTFFNYTNQVNTNTFVRDGQLTYNPTWQMGFSIVPRWYIPDAGFLRANWGFTLEITDDDTNALNREPLLNDLLIDYVHLFSLGEGFILMPMARVTVPISRASLAAQRYLQLAGQLTLIKIIPEAGNLTLAVLGRYGHWFSGSNVVQTDAAQPDNCATSIAAPTPGGDVGPTLAPTCGQFGTPTTSQHVILAGISATMTPIGAFSINLSAFLFTTHGYGLAPHYQDVDTSEEPILIEDGSPSHWRNFTYFAVSVAYQFLPWLNMSLGIQNSGIVASAYDPSGGLYNPLFTPNTQVFLTATLGLDQLWTAIVGSDEEELSPEELQRRQQGLAAGPSAGGSF